MVVARTGPAAVERHDRRSNCDSSAINSRGLALHFRCRTHVCREARSGPAIDDGGCFSLQPAYVKPVRSIVCQALKSRSSVGW